jgi:hypothetical protein
MNFRHHVIVIPGLGNGVVKHIWATKHWRRYGIVPHVFDAQWKIEEPDFESKFKRALALIDSLTSPNTKISLVGNSAGSSFALNLFGKRKHIIHRVVINGGRVRTGDWPWFTFVQATNSSPSFKTSVLLSEIAEHKLSTDDRNKILTLRPIFDEVVPPWTVPIQRATNEVTLSIEHAITIGLNMTLLSRRIIDFILS